MKKLFFLFSLTFMAFFSVLFISCSKDEDNSSSDNITQQLINAGWSMNRITVSSPIDDGRFHLKLNSAGSLVGYDYGAGASRVEGRFKSVGTIETLLYMQKPPTSGYSEQLACRTGFAGVYRYDQWYVVDYRGQNYHYYKFYISEFNGSSATVFYKEWTSEEGVYDRY